VLKSIIEPAIECYMYHPLLGGYLFSDFPFFSCFSFGVNVYIYDFNGIGFFGFSLVSM
jgi:hypothetical protein